MVFELTGASVDAWLTTAPKAANECESHSIRLHSKVTRTYKPQQIEKTLRTELKRLAPIVDGKRIGVVFDEMSAVMGSLADPQSVIDEERRWADQVNSAAMAVGAHAVWNVCVYEFAALRALRDPVAAVTDLALQHDLVWDLHQGRVAVRSGGGRRIVERLRSVGA
jgi:hypothetical protein